MEQRISKALNYIEDNLSQNLTLALLSDVACISPSRFHQLFKIETGKTPFKFIEEIRVNKAYELITTKRPSVHDLAVELGYNDYETFSRVFKKYFHVAPDDLKAIHVALENTLPNKEGEIIMITIESENELNDELIDQLIKANNIAIEDLDEAFAFRVTSKGDADIAKDKLIKNKFYISPDTKIWERLLKIKD